jgi:hypothetical protein
MKNNVCIRLIVNKKHVMYFKNNASDYRHNQEFDEGRAQMLKLCPVRRLSSVLSPLTIPSQVDDSGHRIPRDPAGKMLESHRILQEDTGNLWNMEAVFRPEIARWIPVNFLCLPAGTGRKSSEKIRKFSGRNTASTKSPGTGSFRTGLVTLLLPTRIFMF